MRTAIFVLSLMLMITACGRQSIITDGSRVDKLRDRETRTIEFWHTYSDEETRLLEDVLIPQFQRDNPDITVKPVRQGNNIELKYALISKASADRAPDVVRMDIAWVPEFAQSGLLIPLSGFGDFGRVMKALQYNAGSAGYHEGAYYSLPVNMNTKVAIYNRALLKKAGLTAPPPTFQEVIELARKERFLIGLSGLDGWRSLPYIYALGGRMTNEAYTQATGYLNGEATVAAVEQLYSLYEEQLIDRGLINGGGDNWGGVKTGNILVTDEGPWFYSVFQGTALKQAIDATIAVPFPDQFGPASIMGGEDLVIPKGSDNTQEAWTFMKWMTGKEAQTVMSQTGLIPANLEAKAIKAQAESFIPPFAQALNQTFLRPPVKNWSRIDEVYTGYMKQIFQGELTPRQGLTQAAAEIDRLLAE